MPDDGRGQIRQGRKRGSNKQKRRRVVPAVVIGEVMPDRAYFGGLVQRPVVSGGRLPIERQSPRCPDIDEVVGDRPTVRVDQKMAAEEGAAENDQITKRKRQPHQCGDARGVGIWRDRDFGLHDRRSAHAATLAGRTTRRATSPAIRSSAARPTGIFTNGHL
jgi:hypothetical protein